MWLFFCPETSVTMASASQRDPSNLQRAGVGINRKLASETVTLVCMYYASPVWQTKGISARVIM